ncbi:MAG: tRNA pseudouridine(55) synthase TruB [Bacteroidetes bacterium]|nr:tRNA pseudouridine(55) synthase TruB [Bacteroidota bacterium]MBP7400084.1 tRNA pseudouridine(55) synthase TruB [Chitinophagales bacterium]MBK7110102.1 tRNA pseudouridine(55) synthase TruB [Bacteroidota bacterium]MBK8487172.1 tRNA pseudouridine(55) synthase TruB [Bacteroidota bacterium]MBK8680558.1 tRNA pseudouridine(55) synthase TruB [Bacteroidota bacterium]
MFPASQFLEGTFLLIDKPIKWTSHDVVNKVRYHLSRYCKVKKLKVGHAGTLDPLATGLLILATGKFTKQLDSIITQDKEYSGSFFLGGTTASFDAETEVNSNYLTAHITSELIHETAKQFVGIIMQFPPAHSAVKVQGKPLYVHARKGIEVEVAARPIEISSFEITGIEMPLVHFKVNCSKGTYIRTLANDFGKALNSGAYLSNLCRTRIGDYFLVDALSLESFLQSLKVD